MEFTNGQRIAIKWPDGRQPCGAHYWINHAFRRRGDRFGVAVQCRAGKHFYRIEDIAAFRAAGGMIDAVPDGAKPVDDCKSASLNALLGMVNGKIGNAHVKGPVLRGSTVSVGGGVVGRYVGLSPAGVAWVAYANHDFGAMCEQFDREFAVQP